MGFIIENSLDGSALSVDLGLERYQYLLVHFYLEQNCKQLQEEWPPRCTTCCSLMPHNPRKSRQKQLSSSTTPGQSPLAILHLQPVLHHKSKAAGSAPYRPWASPFTATSRPFLEWDAPQHGAGGQTQTLSAYLDGDTSDLTHQIFTDATCLLSGRQSDVTPRGLHGATELPRLQHLRSQECRSHHVSPNGF